MEDYETDAFIKKFLTITLVIAAYWISSISTVFINKHVLTLDELDAPVFISWLQSVVTVICAFLATFLKNIYYKNDTKPYVGSFISHIKVSRLTLIFIGMILFNNYTLKLVPLPFYTIARALSTFFNMIFTLIILKQKISWASFICCVAVIFGFIMGVFDERITTVDLSWISVLCGILSSLFVSLFAIFTKFYLKEVNNDAWLLQTINNINASFLFLPLIALMGDASLIFHLKSFKPLSPWNWLSVLFSGVMGFLVGLCTNLQIKYTSPLAHNISGTAKAYVQTVLAVYFYDKTRRSTIWWISNIIVIGGSAAFSYTRSKEMLEEEKPLK